LIVEFEFQILPPAQGVPRSSRKSVKTAGYKRPDRLANLLLSRATLHPLPLSRAVSYFGEGRAKEIAELITSPDLNRERAWARKPWAPAVNRRPNLTRGVNFARRITVKQYEGWY
jgi:hypothetical protein